MKVGDLLIQKSDDKEHVGLVTQIKVRPGWRSNRVLVEWSTDAPSNYHWEYGYSCVNIHNQHHVFQVIEA